jgi:hypothetical protein
LLLSIWTWMNHECLVRVFIYMCLGHTGNSVCCKLYLSTQGNINFELPAIWVLKAGCLIAFHSFPVLLAVTKSELKRDLQWFCLTIWYLCDILKVSAVHSNY